MATIWKVEGLKVTVLDQGEGTVIAQWKFNTGSTTDHFNIYWEYWNTTNGVWVLSNGSSSSVPTSSYETKDGVRWFQTTWSPSGAAETSTKLRIYVDPIPKSGSSWRHGGVYSTPITNPKWTNAHGEALEAPSVSTEWVGDQVRLNVGTAPALVGAVAWYRSVDGGAFSKIIESAPTVPVTVTPADGHWHYYAAAWRLAGEKTMGEMSLPTEGFCGRPLRPTKLTARLASCNAEEGSVRLDWEDHGEVGDKYLVEWSEDPSAWDDHADVESDESDGSPSGGSGWRTIGGLEPGKTYWFRVRRGESDAEDAYEWSDYACVGTNGKVLQVSCVVGTVPTAPTLGTVPATAAADEGLRLSWTHNSEDGSAQTAYQLQAYVNGAWTDVSTGAADMYHTVVPSQIGFTDGSTMQWRVRTKGGLDTGSSSDWSPWSATGSVGVWAKPAATIAVAASVDALPLAVSIDVGATAAGNAPTRYWMQVRADEAYEVTGPDGEPTWVAYGESVWSGEAVPGDEGCTTGGWSVSLGAADIRLAPGASYEVTGGCFTAQGLRSEATPATFVAALTQGIVDGCDATVTFDRSTLSATIMPTCTDGPEGELVGGVTLSVWRLDVSGNVLVASGLANDGEAACLDPHPTFGGCTYRVVATEASTGAQGASDVYADTPAPGIVIQWGESWDLVGGEASRSGGMLVLPYNVAVEEQWSKESSLNEWAGRKSPVSRYGTHLGRTATWSCVLNKWDGRDQSDAVRRLAAWMGDAYVREPYGTGYAAHVDVTRLGTRYDSSAVEVTLTVTMVEE